MMALSMNGSCTLSKVLWGVWAKKIYYKVSTNVFLEVLFIVHNIQTYTK